MEKNELKDILESLLFVSEGPLDVRTVEKVLNINDTKLIQAALKELMNKYEENPGGFHIVEIANGYQMCTRQVFAPWIKKLLQANISNKLSKQALETLAIIAYRQPVTKVQIESIRGVISDGVLNTLMDRNLIRLVGRQEGIGRPFLYGTTKEFLQQFGLKDLKDLPTINELDQLFSRDAGLVNNASK